MTIKERPPIAPPFPSPRLNQLVRDMAAFYVYSGCYPEVDRSDGGFHTRIIGPEGPINVELLNDWIDHIFLWEDIAYKDAYPLSIWHNAICREMALIRAGR